MDWSDVSFKTTVWCLSASGLRNYKAIFITWNKYLVILFQQVAMNIYNFHLV